MLLDKKKEIEIKIYEGVCLGWDIVLIEDKRHYIWLSETKAQNN